MKKKFEHFEDEYGITFVSHAPYNHYALFKDRKMIHNGIVINLQESLLKVQECAVEWIEKWAKENEE